MIEERFKKVAEIAVNSIEGIRRTGIRVIELRGRYAKMMMPLEGNINHVGMMYAGSLFTLGEFCGGIIYGVAFDVEKYYPIVKDISIRFRRPAMTDVTIEVSMSEEDAGEIQQICDENDKSDFVLDLEIKDAGGEVVALVKGTWQIRKMPEGMGNLFE
ncbi:MAG: YiiD C-terminal domain-containing protein [Deltaproteobacteria bacterium]|nr:YiiD C-terminal domain-containing protein [Deltaproteobacteria bacterium]MBW2595715.1 YiiD C-terminal domain-containing protein [Deltaproteobacteria bacterium]